MAGRNLFAEPAPAAGRNLLAPEAGEDQTDMGRLLSDMRRRLLNGIPIVGPATNLGLDYIDALNEQGGVTPEQEASGEYRRGTLAPVMVGNGEFHAAWPQIALDIVEAFELPGDVMAGKVDPMSDEGIGRAAKFGLTFTGGNAPAVSRIAAADVPRRAAPGVARAASMSRPAAEAVTRAAGADEALGPAGRAAVEDAGPDAMLADAGPALAALLDTAVQRSGPGATRARRRIEARAANANQTANTALDEALGVPQGVKATETGIRTGTAGARQAAYDAAYAAPIDYSLNAGRSIERLLGQVPQGVIALANRMMQLEGHQSSQILAQIADDGAVTFMRLPDVRQLDYITRALNQAAKSGEGQGALGGQTDIGRLYGDLARQLREQTRTAVPEYDNALRTAAAPIAEREALRFGEGLLSPKMTRSEADEVIGTMTGPELTAARQGVRSYIDDVLANVRAVASDPNLDAREARKALQDLSSRAAREKITMLLGDEAAANRLFFQLGQAFRALELRAAVSTNSRTFGRLAMDEAVTDHITGGVTNAALRGEPINAAKAAIQSVTGHTPRGERRMADAVYEEIADILTGSQGNDALDLLAVLSNASRQAGTSGGGAAMPSTALPILEFLEQFQR